MVQRVDSSLYPLETKKRKVRSAESGAKGTVYCPVYYENPEVFCTAPLTSVS